MTRMSLVLAGVGVFAACSARTPPPRFSTPSPDDPIGAGGDSPTSCGASGRGGNAE
jgi:hypothetical protein